MRARPTGEPICGSVAAGRLGGSWLCLLGKPGVPCWAAYAKAPRTPLTPHWLRIPTRREAIASDRSLSTAGAQLPDAKETGTALLQLANTAKTKMP